MEKCIIQSMWKSPPASKCFVTVKGEEFISPPPIIFIDLRLVQVLKAVVEFARGPSHLSPQQKSPFVPHCLCSKWHGHGKSGGYFSADSTL